MRVHSRPSDCVVEEEYALCAWYTFQEQFGHFRVEHVLDFLFRIPIFVAHGGRDMGEGGEGIVVECVDGFVVTNIVNGYSVVFCAVVTLWSRCWGFDVVPRLFRGMCQIMLVNGDCEK